jgi:hypothetical protein
LRPRELPSPPDAPPRGPTCVAGRGRTPVPPCSTSSAPRSSSSQTTASPSVNRQCLCSRGCGPLARPHADAGATSSPIFISYLALPRSNASPPSRGRHDARIPCRRGRPTPPVTTPSTSDLAWRPSSPWRRRYPPPPHTHGIERLGDLLDHGWAWPDRQFTAAGFDDVVLLWEGDDEPTGAVRARRMGPRGGQTGLPDSTPLPPARIAPALPSLPPDAPTRNRATPKADVSWLQRWAPYDLDPSHPTAALAPIPFLTKSIDRIGHRLCNLALNPEVDKFVKHGIHKCHPQSCCRNKKWSYYTVEC